VDFVCTNASGIDDISIFGVANVAICALEKERSLSKIEEEKMTGLSFASHQC
jgi:hypothetical protein